MQESIFRGVLFCALEWAISCSALGQVATPRALDVPPEAVLLDLRLSWELGALGRGVNEPLIAPTRILERLTDSGIALGRQLSPETETDSGEAMINREVAETRRFVPPPGELNTAGVVRAGRMSIVDGVPVLQRDQSAEASQSSLAQGDGEER